MKPMHRTPRELSTRAASLLLSLALTACGTTQFVPAPSRALPALPKEARPESVTEPTWCLGQCSLQLSQRVQQRNTTLQTSPSMPMASDPPASSARATTTP